MPTICSYAARRARRATRRRECAAAAATAAAARHGDDGASILQVNGRCAATRASRIRTRAAARSRDNDKGYAGIDGKV